MWLDQARDSSLSRIKNSTYRNIEMRATPKNGLRSRQINFWGRV
jgi:hypothetical protein